MATGTEFILNIKKSPLGVRCRQKCKNFRIVPWLNISHPRCTDLNESTHIFTIRDLAFQNGNEMTSTSTVFMTDYPLICTEKRSSIFLLNCKRYQTSSACFSPFNCLYLDNQEKAPLLPLYRSLTSVVVASPLKKRQKSD